MDVEEKVLFNFLFIMACFVTYFREGPFSTEKNVYLLSIGIFYRYVMYNRSVV